MKVTFGKLRDRLRGTGPIGTVQWLCLALWRLAAIWLFWRASATCIPLQRLVNA